MIDITPIGQERAYESIYMLLTTFEEGVEITLDYSTPLDKLSIMMDEGDNYLYTGNGSLYHLTFSFALAGPHNISIDFETDEFSILDDGKMIYSPTFSFPMPPAFFRCRLFLDEGMSITTPLVPSPNKVYSQGDEIIILWENISSQSSFYILCAINDMRSADNSAWYLSLLVIPGLLAGYLFGRRRPKNSDAVKPGFKTDEEHVMRLLVQGVQTHKELVDATGFSKSKITRILQEMEERDVIKREKYKKKNIIFLNKDNGHA
ncbi:MAG: hypothetical protein JW825_06435 [Candidatus Methanofastidiosa archaeon]|nr:hypothetical protein [Candidatus Methanofastidiosa archaeon]